MRNLRRISKKRRSAHPNNRYPQEGVDTLHQENPDSKRGFIDALEFSSSDQSNEDVARQIKQQIKNPSDRYPAIIERTKTKISKLNIKRTELRGMVDKAFAF